MHRFQAHLFTEQLHRECSKWSMHGTQTAKSSCSSFSSGRSTEIHTDGQQHCRSAPEGNSSWDLSGPKGM